MMQMSNEEILKSYKEAKDQKAQIKVLADLNACKPADIVNVLAEQGIEISLPGKTKPGKPSQIPEEKFRALYDAGKNDTEIAAESGFSKASVCRWRSYTGLPPMPKKEDKRFHQQTEPAPQPEQAKESCTPEICKPEMPEAGWREEQMERQAELIRAYRIVMLDLVRAGNLTF